MSFIDLGCELSWINIHYHPSLFSPSLLINPHHFIRFCAGESESLPAVELTSADEGEFPPAHHSEGTLPESGKEEGMYAGEEAGLGGGAEQGLPEPTAEIGGAGGGATWEHYEGEFQSVGIGCLMS